MKIMRYRIRQITLVMIAALLAVSVWCVRGAWLTAFSGQEPLPATAETVTAPDPEPSSTPVPKGNELPEATPVPSEAPPSAEPEATADPLFDTFGL